MCLKIYGRKSEIEQFDLARLVISFCSDSTEAIDGVPLVNSLFMQILTQAGVFKSYGCTLRENNLTTVPWS